MSMTAKCIVANSMYTKFVEGYLSHQHCIAVLSE